jgi:hypothetical protein
MSMMAAINTAIQLQLVADGKAAAHYNNYGLVMSAADLAYTDTSIMVFLQLVAMRLGSDNPPLNFDWTDMDATRCLASNRTMLINLIARKTKPIVVDKP